MFNPIFLIPKNKKTKVTIRENKTIFIFLSISLSLFFLKAMDRQDSDDIMKFLDGMASSDDVLFGFLDGGNHSPEIYPDSGNFTAGEESDADNDAAGSNSEENKTFWLEQEQLLQVIFLY